MSDYLQELNQSQREAVEFIDGACLIIAGAGSGKTRVLTYKIVHLLKNGIKPNSILALTFTNKAAKEMKERIKKTAGTQWTYQLWMGTFHSIFARILRQESEKLGFPSSFSIYDTIDSKSLLRSIIKDLNLDPVKQYPINQIYGRISKAKNNLILPDVYASRPELIKQDFHNHRPETAKIYKLYAQRCQKADAMDFDDLLLYTNILFRNHPEVLDKYRKQFQYILVDEYQDTNTAQYLIVKQLSMLRKRITVVGDDAQSIYAFRGARIENIFNFKKDFPEHKLFKLERNYRSTQNIVEAANSVIAKNKQQIKKNVYSKKEHGAKIQIKEIYNEREEGKFVIKELKKIVSAQKHEYLDFAILYRTNAQSRIFEEELLRNNIPHRVYGGMSFYQRKEIKDLLAYLRLTINHNDDEAIRRVLNYPRRGIGGTTEEKIYKYADDNSTTIWEALRSVNKIQMGLNPRAINKILGFVNLIEEFTSKIPIQDAFEITDEIAKSSGILKDLYKDKTPQGLSRRENIQELLNAIKDFTEAKEEVDEKPTLNKFLEDVALLTNDDKKDEDKNKVSLMTVHSAKGLEYKNVFIVGVEMNLFPSFMATQNPNDKKALEEERRLFYVAITRAEVNLIISHAKKRTRWGKTANSSPSRFINDINSEFVEFHSAGVDSEVNYNNNADYTEKEQRFNTFVKKKPKYSYDNFAKETTEIGMEETTHDIKTGIKTGMQVVHRRFGIGKVISIKGQYPDSKALIDFEQAGKKQLLLKFAKLKIVS